MYYTYNMKETNYIRKGITITREQEDWVQKNSINLSRFIQQCLNERIKQHKK